MFYVFVCGSFSLSLYRHFQESSQRLKGSQGPATVAVAAAAVAAAAVVVVVAVAVGVVVVVAVAVGVVVVVVGGWLLLLLLWLLLAVASTEHVGKYGDVPATHSPLAPMYGILTFTPNICQMRVNIQV